MVQSKVYYYYFNMLIHMCNANRICTTPDFKGENRRLLIAAVDRNCLVRYHVSQYFQNKMRVV